MTLASSSVLVPTFASLILIAFTSFYVWSSPLILLTCVGWALGYTVVCQLLQMVVDKEAIEGYPRWSYYASAFHQGVTLPILVLFLLFSHITSDNRIFQSSDYVGMYWWQWLQTSWKPDMLVEQLIHCSIIGAMLKDYWVYGDCNQWFFLVHHVLTIAGCSLCLILPSGVGFVTLNALNAEILSVTYNFKMLFPRGELLLVQLLLMGISNIAGLWIAVTFIRTSEVPWYLCLTYGLMAILIVLIRCGGWAKSLQEIVAKFSSPVQAKPKRS